MLSFHNAQKIKDKYVKRVKEHQEADRIIKGTGWENGKGCAVGCTLEKYSHDAYESELGLPVWLAYLEDKIFERLPEKEALKFPLRFLESIPVGVDVDIVKTKLSILRLENFLEFISDTKCKESIESVILFHKKIVSGEYTTRSAARSAENHWIWEDETLLRLLSEL